jgi:alginate O-acetyltransferase complex protein AlgI
VLFNSFQFAVFFPIVTSLYFLLPHRYRWGLLLAASCVFYMAFVAGYILILAVTIVIDYLAALRIHATAGRARRLYLLGSIVSTCAVLFVFKYIDFFNGSIATVAQVIGWRYPVGPLDILLPIGLSFHTFQSLSYVIEVYWGRQQPERHFGIYSLYVMFYPQLVAGPIERPQHLLHQFREVHSFDEARVRRGLQLMVWGLFKKVVIADRLSPLVATVFNNPHAYPGIPSIIATFFFAFQIYCDFSGYSDIAIGSAQVMGFTLMRNFNRPYFARTIGEFWGRWHISLSTWFRDYVYIPLGGNRSSPLKNARNVLVTFTVSGLWHGAAWTYAVWGAFHGIGLLCERAARALRWIVDSSIAGMARTFIFVCIGWVFFRARTISDAGFMLSHSVPEGMRQLLTLRTADGASRAHLVWLDHRPREVLLSLLFIGVLLGVDAFQARVGSVRDVVSRQSPAMRWAMYYALVGATLLFGVFTQTQFIYFQF